AEVPPGRRAARAGPVAHAVDRDDVVQRIAVAVEVSTAWALVRLGDERSEPVGRQGDGGGRALEVLGGAGGARQVDDLVLRVPVPVEVRPRRASGGVAGRLGPDEGGVAVGHGYRAGRADRCDRARTRVQYLERIRGRRT